ARENLFKALDMAPCLLEVLFERTAEFRRTGSLGHFRQGLHQSLFGVVDVLEFVHVKVFKTLHDYILLLIDGSKFAISIIRIIIRHNRMGGGFFGKSMS